jgi:hypothetical protein
MSKCPYCEGLIHITTLKSEPSYDPAMYNAVMLSCNLCDKVLGFVQDK